MKKKVQCFNCGVDGDKNKNWFNVGDEEEGPQYICPKCIDDCDTLRECYEDWEYHYDSQNKLAEMGSSYLQ